MNDRSAPHAPPEGAALCTCCMACGKHCRCRKRCFHAGASFVPTDRKCWACKHTESTPEKPTLLRG